MKKQFILFAVIFILFSCDKKSKVEKEVEEIPIEITVNRFDKAFFGAKPQDLPALKRQYPFFFPAGNDDAVWIEKMQNPLWRELYGEVQKKFGNFETETTQIEDLIRHIRYYFPAVKTPAVYTVIGDMDYTSKALYAKDTIVIALELYLGKDHKYYINEFPQYLQQNFDPSQMMPDIVSSFALGKIPPPDNTLLAQMIYAGKELYLKDVLLPEHSDAAKMGYQPEQITWCEENESYMWRYFIENSLLYDSDSKLPPRFINPAPFSKFYLEIDNESPGRVGAWLGWQIVRSYMDNNEVPLQQMLQTDARQLFERSKYKPKKNE
ncbi:MAG TPA: gliding motility lipoprotein GldB [Flavobacterium sp.]|jgi:gliding motility-associated lipoprotein GldB